MLLKEDFIYLKIKDNNAPYWELYTISNHVRSATPTDVYSPDEEMDEPRKVETSIARLRSVLDLYRKNVVGEAPAFFIVLKKSAKSHSSGRFEYEFVLDVKPSQPQQNGLGGVPAQANMLMQDFVPKSVWELREQLNKKDILLSVKEAQLEDREKRLKELERELERRNKPYVDAMDRAVVKALEYFSGGGSENSTSDGLGGVPPERQQDAALIEERAEYMYNNFSGKELAVIYNFLEKFKNQLRNGKVAQDKQSGTTDTATETTTDTANQQ